MQIALVGSVLGRLLMLFSVTMLTPLPLDLYFGEGSWPAFALSFGAALTAGSLIWLPFRHSDGELKLRDGFLIVASFWVVLGSFGAAPLFFATEPELSFTDAMFEAISGLTTTGATVLTGLDEMPKAILFYRQQLQWLGGLGIVVLAVAVLPMLGVGGMQLYRAETPGPMKDNRLTPRIKETAKALWYIYCALTAACGLAYYLAGMPVFDAVSHAFSTVAIGGFSTHDASFAHFPQTGIRLIAVIFMFLAGINFSLHFIAFNRRTLAGYFQGRGISGLRPCHADAMRAHGGRLAGLGLVQRSLHGADRRHFPVRVDHDDYRLHHRRFFSVARHSPNALDAIRLHGRLRRIHSRRHEVRARVAAGKAGHARGAAAGASER